MGMAQMLFFSGRSEQPTIVVNALPARNLDWVTLPLPRRRIEDHKFKTVVITFCRGMRLSTLFQTSFPSPLQESLSTRPPMTTDIDSLKEKIKRWTLILGVLQITVGCLAGFTPPSAVAWFRGIVMAHIEFTANGVLLVAFGFLVRELRLSPGALWVWFATLQIGTWTNGAAGQAAAFIGASSKLMPTINEKFPPPHGIDNPIVSGSLMLCGVTITVALLITLYGLWRSKTSGYGSNA